MFSQRFPPHAMSTEPAILTIPTPRPRAAAQSAMVGLGLFCVAHFFIDLYASAMGAFHILLINKLGISLAQAGVLGAMMTFSGSFVQPAYGYLSDRYHSRLFSALAPAVAAIFISSLGLATNFWMAAFLILAGGVGVASFHPQASARATYGLLTNRGKWMGVFISAGTLGLAVGPSYFTAVVQGAGLQRSYLAAIPGVIVTLLLLTWLRQPAHLENAPRQKLDFAPLRAVWKPLLVLHVTVVLRSGVQIVFGQFLPLYLHRERKYSLAAAAGALLIYQLGGAIGGFAGGHLQDRFGGKRVILISMIGAVPCLMLFFFTTGLVSMIGLALSGLILLFTVPVNVVMAQEIVPTQAGTVSSLMMGFAWGLAGLMFIPLLGWASDRVTMHVAMSCLTILPFVGFFVAMALPKDRVIRA
jgi:FSR family fosmidomycin resistance protein-like MFS transporter